MKITLSKLIACLILAGVINATVIEPAFCFQHDEAAVQQQEQANGSHCMVCHHSHHQGIVPSVLSPRFSITNPMDLVHLPDFFLSESPVRSIFHPPLAF